METFPSDAVVAEITGRVKEAESRRTATLHAYSVLRERDPDRIRALILAHTLELLDATIARAYELSLEGDLRLAPADGAAGIPPLAVEMESELVPRALVAGKSLISNHPALDPALGELAARCQAEGIITHVLLIRAHGATHGAIVVHWIARDRPPVEQRHGFYTYWDTAGISMAAARERECLEFELEQLRRSAFQDKLTGLPSPLALEDQLSAHAGTEPFSVLVLDFDGLGEANDALGYRDGGDLLIRTVGQALAELARGDEFPARMHTAGDEFVVLLPQCAENEAAVRALEIEAALAEVVVPETLRGLYRGASVGHASRGRGETPGQVLGHAIEAMRWRKLTRRRS